MKGKFRQSSIGARMLLVMGVVLLLQTGLITGSIIGSGAIERLSENSYDIFNQKIITRKNYLEYEMISRWSNLTEAEQKIEAHFSRVLEKNNAGFDEIETNSDLAVELLRNSAEDVPLLHLPGQLGYPDRAGSDRHYQGTGDPDGF